MMIEMMKISKSIAMECLWLTLISFSSGFWPQKSKKDTRVRRASPSPEDLRALRPIPYCHMSGSEDATPVFDMAPPSKNISVSVRYDGDSVRALVRRAPCISRLCCWCWFDSGVCVCVCVRLAASNNFRFFDNQTVKNMADKIFKKIGKRKIKTQEVKRISKNKQIKWTQEIKRTFVAQFNDALTTFVMTDIRFLVSCITLSTLVKVAVFPTVTFLTANCNCCTYVGTLSILSKSSFFGEPVGIWPWRF